MPPRLVVIGAGEQGLEHARRLRKGVAEGRVDATVELVRDGWLERLSEWLDGDEAAKDYLVPAPIQPHLAWEWLLETVAADPVAPPRGWALPYEVPGANGVLHLSAAAWTCPASCVEPAHCPALHAPRDWDLADLIEERARAEGWEPAVFRCLHLAEGVGAIPAASLLDARRRLKALPAGSRVLVATSSRCHATVAGLQLAEVRPEAPR